MVLNAADTTVIRSAILASKSLNGATRFSGLNPGENFVMADHRIRILTCPYVECEENT
jgi:hypothetical protein